ncbi:hypothetical protein [Flavobacterium sp.]|uniref:hypothetical protein n=1 Tax=Flavobacterium sp. TaxID=239 RepID=UPI0025DDCF59|nr:hypothetical protein [Flavobacterium sp.]
MELNKIEKQIKKKLDSREIQPSAQAWDRLDAMLSVAEEKKTSRPFGFLFIAASITVLLAVGLFFFTQNGREIMLKNDVVTTETKDSVRKNVKQMPQVIKQNQVVISTKTQNPESQSTNNNKSVSISNQKSAINNQLPIHQNPLINREKEIQYQNSSDLALKNLPVIETRKEIVLPVKNIPSDEQLLAGLDKAAKQSSEKNTLVKINPKSLLSQVDGELELTFREKVINKMAKNYKEVKVALANRNNE